MSEEKNMFESLRLGAGGGLKSIMEKAEQASDAATIAIGLGGTGVGALRMLKKCVYERVKQDNYKERDTQAPIYQKIKFLAIDSDSTGIYSEIPELDFSNEFFPIGIGTIVNELADKAYLNQYKHLEWLNREIEMKDAKNGAGGIRQIGKYLLSKKANELYNKFKEMITVATMGLNADTSNLNIYVMAGLGGGTGSGCFIDVCYLMQQALKDKSWQASANILGFFFLPDVNISNPKFRRGGPEERTLKKNGYAALKELDYLMEIPNNGDCYTQAYSEAFEITQSVAPVKMCHLLSTTNIDGTSIANGYNYVMNAVAEYALNFVVKAQNADKNGRSDAITLKGIQANIGANVANIRKSYGVGYCYNILGASCATVPYQKIGTYLAIRFFDSIKYIQKIKPTRSDVQKFCQRVGLEFQKLDVAVKAQTPSFTLNANDFETSTIKSAAVGEISKPLSEYCNRWKDGYANKRVSNIKTLGRRLDSYNIDEAPESVIGKVFKELISIINNPDLGPYFAAYMMGDAQNHTISSELAGIRMEVQKKLDHATSQNRYRWDAEAKAQADFRTSNFLTESTKKRTYISMVEQRYRNEVEIETYTEFLALVDKIIKQLEELEIAYFKKYSGIVDKLITTFEDNDEFFKTHGMGNEMYTWSIIDINDVKNDLDAEIEKYMKQNEDGTKTASALVDLFNKLMLKNQDKWLDESEVKITELISEFIRDTFKGIMSKTMKQYLAQKYGQTGQDLITSICNGVFSNGLIPKGKPIFYCEDSFPINDALSHAEYISLSVPNNEPDIVAAAEKYKEQNGTNMTIAENVLTDRIFMLEFYSGIPMYAYKELQNLEKEYDANPTVGMHMYESKDKDWRQLPSPIPATYVSTNYNRTKQATVDDIIHT